ncbi:MAG: RNA methyltransferase [Candidatus Diapherotrites archaeon]|nr:RNA methyltransferase [Candidatus Diapherotrites archaeon]
MFRVVLVEPHYGGNIGSVARLMQNFGFRELYLVNPLANPLGDEAMRWAVHAKHVLESARIVKSIEEAIDDCAVVAATTAKPGPKMVRRTPLTPREFAEKFSEYWNSDERVAILFGREPSGLTNEELELADIAVTIPTSQEYPAMNLSHSVGVILYELAMQKRMNRKVYDPPREQSYELAERIFQHFIDTIGRQNPQETMNAFKAILRRGAKTDKELRAVIGVLSEIEKRWLGR